MKGSLCSGVASMSSVLVQGSLFLTSLTQALTTTVWKLLFNDSFISKKQVQ